MAFSYSIGNMSQRQLPQSNRTGIDHEHKEVDVVQSDHCYSKSWNTQSDLSQADNAKYILLAKDSSLSSVWHSDRPLPNEDDELDVETIDKPVQNGFENHKVRTLLTECERHMKVTRPHSHSVDEPINRSGWSPTQNKAFNKLFKILNSARLARLSSSGTPVEPVFRRIYCDKHAARARQLFSAFNWDMSLLSWLHTTCMERLSSALLSDYLELLQTLKHKCPTLIEEMIRNAEYTGRMNNPSKEALDLLLKRPWDPTGALSTKPKLEKLPKDPIILVLPQMVNLNEKNTKIITGKTKRLKLWNLQLSAVAKVIYVAAPKVSHMPNRWRCFDELVTLARATVIETSQTYSGRPIILLGWNFGGLLATYVSTMEKVSAAVALGYPMLGINGLRGDADDIVMDSDTPTLFVVGEHAQNCPITELENMRERMKARNSLVVVSGAGDNLTINFKTKKEICVTQGMVDRILLSEVMSFLTRILTSTQQNRMIVGVHLPVQGEMVKKKKYAVNVRKLAAKRKDGSLPPSTKKKKTEKVSRKQEVLYDDNMAAESAAASSRLAALTREDQAAACPLSLSSSSQGSLAALKPVSLPVPLNVSPESNKTTVQTPPAINYKLETNSSSQKSFKLAPAPILPTPEIKMPAVDAHNMPALVQLSGQAGQTYAITLEKARELLGLGVIKSISNSRSFETTRHLLKKSTSTSHMAISPSVPTHSHSIPTTPVTIQPSSIETTNSSQHIRNLLSIQSSNLALKAVPEKKPATGSLPANITASTATMSSVNTATSTATPTSLSPGQSLIRKVKVTASTSYTPRQMFTAMSSNDASRTRTISLILGSNKSSAPEKGPEINPPKNVSIPVTQDMTTTVHEVKLTTSTTNNTTESNISKPNDKNDNLEQITVEAEPTENQQLPTDNIAEADNSNPVPQEKGLPTVQ